MWPAVVVFLTLINIPLCADAVPNFLKEPTSQSVLKGRAVNFECQINVAQPIYNWLKDGSNISKGNISPSGLATLKIDNLEFSDSGNYSCVATDKQSGETVTKSATLTVQGVPAVSISKKPSSSATYVGQSALFHCEVVGYPKPVLNWKNSSDAIISSGGRFEVFSNGSLRINNLVKSDDNSLFICKAYNSFGSTSASTTLIVNDLPIPPSFTTRPGNKTASEGDRVTFYCSANGIPPPSITWSKLYGNITADRRQEPSPGALRIVNLQHVDDGVYVCTAKNSEGNVTALAFLRIRGYPRITRTPSNKVVEEHSPVQFTCLIEGNPTPHVEWTTPNGSIFTLQSPHLGTKKIFSNNSLSISMVTESDGGTYTCKAVNDVGERSASATLKVLTPPRFLVPMANRTQNINTQLVVECGAYARPTPEYQWIFNDTIITANRRLNLSSLSLGDQGFYTCVANNSFGSVSGKFYLAIQVPPNFVMSPINQTIPKGKTAIFSCQATGIPVPSIKWYKSQNLITNDVRFTVLSNGTLVVKSVSEQDSGWFTCRATNDAGTSEKRVYFLVADSPVFTIVPSNVTVDERSSATMSCRARGPDEPVVTWMLEKTGGTITNIVLSATVQIHSNGDLTYSSVTLQNGGLHICKACNTAGCASAKAYLDVLFAPRFIVPPNTVYALKGQTAILECKPESNPPATITWLRNGESLAGTGNQYRVNNVEPEDEGSYTCKARNSRGSTQQVVDVKIGAKADIIDFQKTPSQNSKTIMKCEVEGSPRPQVTWYLQGSKLPDLQKLPDYTVNANEELITPGVSLVNNSFLCNCTNPLDTVARFARVPRPPFQPSVTSIMETSLEMTWTQSDPLDLVLQYMVQMKTVVGDWEQVNDTIKGSSVRVNNLQAFTVYSFRVKAKNGLGSSQYSQSSQNVTTLEGAPSTPKDLKMSVENATVVYVSWVKPENLNGYLSTILYRINYGPQNGNSSQDVFVQHNIVRSPQNFTLRELAADTVYMVRVYAGRRRKDGIERWSRAVSKQITTMQLVPLTPPVDLIVQSNGAYQLMVKWKLPSYSISGYRIWYKELEGAVFDGKVVIPRMSDTVYLITGLVPDTKYEVKARMYSNAGNGPFSELFFVETDTDKFAVTSGQSDGTQSSGLKVAVVCLVLGVLLLLIIIAFVCLKRRQAKRSRQSFHISNREDPSLKYIFHNRRTGSTSQVSSSGDSEGSVEGQYNFAPADDEIDVGMFVGDRNSTSFSQDLELRYLDSATSTSYSERNVDDVVRLEEYKPRRSPIVSRGNSVYDEVIPSDSKGKDDRYLKPNNTTKSEGLVDSAGVDNSAFSLSDFVENEAPPNWRPVPPPIDRNQSPVYAQVIKGRKTNPENSVQGPDESAKNEPMVSSPNDQATFTKDSAESLENRPVNNKSDSEVTSDDDDELDRPPPPPRPSQVDDEWVPPLPPEIMALPGRRNHFASWACEDADGAKKTNPENSVQGPDESAKNEPTVSSPNDQATFTKDSAESLENRPVNNKPDLEVTSDDDDELDRLPPPPRPSQVDDEWVPPLPPEIMALPGRRNHFASWACEDADGAKKTNPENSVQGPDESAKNEPTVSSPNDQATFTKDSAESLENRPVNNKPDLEVTSDDDDELDRLPPPPRPSQVDDEWVRPLPPEIMALPGRRNRFASWACEDADGASDFDDLTKI